MSSHSVQVVTVRGRIPDPVSEPYYCYPQFLASLARFGVDPLILTGVWKGLGNNAVWMKQALDQGRIATDYCLFTNCFDVLFVTSPEEILQRFLDLQHMNNGLPSIMFGAEKNCFPSGGETALHPQGFTSYRYLNSGWYIGETQSIAQALKEMNPEENILDDHKDEKGEWVYDNDQSHWQRQMLNGTVPIGLDTECQLVWNMHAVKESEADLSGSRPQCIETHSYPMVLHLNGAASHVWKDKLIAHLGLA